MHFPDVGVSSTLDACITWSSPRPAVPQMALTDKSCPTLSVVRSLLQLGWNFICDQLSFHFVRIWHSPFARRPHKQYRLPRFSAQKIVYTSGGSSLEHCLHFWVFRAEHSIHFCQKIIHTSRFSAQTMVYTSRFSAQRIVYTSRFPARKIVYIARFSALKIVYTSVRKQFTLPEFHLRKQFTLPGFQHGKQFTLPRFQLRKQYKRLAK